MLRALKSGSDQWCEFWKYNDAAQVILHANPSEISGYDEQYADLLYEVSGNFQYLKGSDGLIHTFEYDAASGYLAAERSQQGETGTSIKLQEYEYLSIPLFPQSSRSSPCSLSFSSSSGAEECAEPAGWETLTGGGLHLVTDFEHDELGRTTQTLGPVHTVDIDGTATSIRRADWTVYEDVKCASARLRA